MQLAPKEVMLAYLKALEAADLESLVALFAPAGQVVSPLYGRQAAVDFYRDLLADSQASRVQLLNHWYEEETFRGALHFEYHWTLKNGEEVQFEVVDILQFDIMGKITELRIIYDTQQTRPTWENNR